MIKVYGICYLYDGKQGINLKACVPAHYLIALASFYKLRSTSCNNYYGAEK